MTDKQSIRSIRTRDKVDRQTGRIVVFPLPAEPVDYARTALGNKETDRHG